MALEWRNLISHGSFTTQTELADYLRVSRARVTQMLRLLTLSPRVLDVMVALGDPLSSPVITERMPRRLIRLSFEDQERMMLCFPGNGSQR